MQFVPENKKGGKKSIARAEKHSIVASPQLLGTSGLINL
jgi:hypothetical protein